MPASHPFIDVVILDGVRERFADGDPLVILSTDLEDILWANGPGAALFGHDDIETATGAGSGLGAAARRQIMATRGYPAIGRDRAVMVRLTQGVVTFLASALAMPDGEPAIVLALPSRGGDTETARATRAIGGFTEPGHLLALLGGDGEVLASSTEPDAIGIPTDALADLTHEARQAPDRLVKRLVQSGEALLPAGIAYLTDTPPRYLLVLVDEVADDDFAATPATAMADPKDQGAFMLAETETTTDGASGEDAQLASVDADIDVPDAHSGDIPEIDAVSTETQDGAPDAAGALAGAVTSAATGGLGGSDQVRDEQEAPQEAEPEALGTGREGPIETDEAVDPQPAGEAPATDDAPSMDQPPAEVGEAPVASAPDVAEPAPASRLPDRSAAPLRFVWKTDTGGRFSALSPEFAEAVGLGAGDLLGRPFRQVSERLGLDPSGEIAALLERRDTWSGRSVLWPVAGSGLRVPVDLAALPIYGRDRSFEGFRGFGVARLADAIADTDAAALRLTDGDAAPPAPDLPVAANDSKGEAAPDSTAAAAAPRGGEPDPFRGEVPALEISPKADRRFSDKVIRLAEHRSGAVEAGLSPGERSAFREIGERLRKEDEASSTDVTVATPGTAAPDGVAEPNHILQGEAPASEAINVVSEDSAPNELDHGLTLTGDVVDDADSDTTAPDEAAADTAIATAQAPAPEPSDTLELRGGDGVDPIDEWAVTPPVDETASVELPEPDHGLSVALPADNGAEAPNASSNESSVEPNAGGSVEPAEEAMTETGRPGIADEAATADAVEQTPAQTLESELAAIDAAEPLEAEHAAQTPVGEDLDASSEEAAEESQALPTTDLVATETSPEPVPLLLHASAVAATAGETDGEEETPASDPNASGHDGDGSRAAATETAILSRLPVPLLIHSGDALHYANPEFLELTGFSSIDALREAGGLGCLFPERYDEPEEGADHALRLRRSDGQEFPIEALLRSIPWEDGHALMLVVRRSGDAQGAPAAADPARDALRAHVAELRTIIDTATDGVIVIGTNGLIRSISRPAEALFGYESDDVAGKPFVSLFAMESQRAARDYLTSLSDHGVASVLNDGREVIGREAQGRFIPMFLSIGKLPNDGGYCAVVRDITPWKRAEEELTQSRTLAERASSQKSDFLARISHEIRTPLNAIIGFSELMVDERFGPIGNDRYRDYLRDINKSGNHVLDLVNDLLDISKIEAGEQEMTYEAVSLNEAIAQTVAMMQPQANRDRVIIRSSFASRLPDVVADLRSIRQIALNLLSNAVRYTQAGGQVIVSTSYEPTGDVVIRVRDTGIGMTPAEIEQALKPFKQINALKGGRSDGTGLGLPLTKAMVEANRARFTINSTPGEGTLVEITFPSTRVLAE